MNADSNNGSQPVSTTTRYLPRSVEFVFYTVVFVTLGSLLYWWTEQSPIALVERKLLTPVVRIGEPVKIRNVVYLSDRCEVEVTRTFVDETGLIHTIISESIPEQRTDNYIVFVSSAVIPPTVVPGKVIYRVSATWYCNSLQQLFPTTVQLSDIEITVKE